MTNTLVKDLLANRSQLAAFGQNRDSVAEHAALRKKTNAEAQQNWGDPAFHRQVAADMAVMMDYGFTFNNLFQTYLQVENVGEFDRVVLKERRGLKVFYTAKGGYIEESQLRTEQWELPRDTMGFHVSEFEDKLRANFAASLESIISLGMQRFDAEVNRRIFSLLQAAIPASSPYYAAVATLDPATLNAAVTEVADAIKPDGAGPVPITIAGRAAVVDAISDFTGYADEAKEEIRLKGRLGTYRGANIVRINNWADEDGNSYIPDDELWVFGGTVGKFALYGDMRVKSWEENTVDYFHYRARKDLGGLVNHPEQARRIKITG